jgi:plasmid maintenance system antidote protein VapI
MHNPPHPGGIVRRQCPEPLGLTITEAADGLGVTRQALSDLEPRRRLLENQARLLACCCSAFT